MTPPATARIEVDLASRDEFEQLVEFAGKVGRIAVDREDVELARLVKGLCDQLGIVAREPKSYIEAIAQHRNPDYLRRLIELAEMPERGRGA